MKNFKKLFLVGAMLLSTFAGVLFARSANKNASAALLGEGETLDETVDSVSISDLTFNGLTNQSALNELINTDVSYNKTDAEGSLVFKFKYEFNETTNTDKTAVRIHFDVADDKWNEQNAYWIRGDGLYLQKYRNPGFSYSGKDPLPTLGTYLIEVGRIAIFNDGTPTGNYYCYIKVDGNEINACVNPYDTTKMGNTMFINVGGDPVNKKNPILDVNLSYEKPQLVSVSDLSKDGKLVGDTLPNENGTFRFSTSGATINKSFKVAAYLECIALPNFDFHLLNAENELKNAAMVAFRETKLCVGKTDAEGKHTGYAEVSYPFAVGETYLFEYSRLAVMDGETFTGVYHVCVKINNSIVYSIDERVVEVVANGGKIISWGHKDKVTITTVTSTETPKVISVSDLYNNSAIGDYQVLNKRNDVQQYAYSNEDHAENYSLVFKFKYEVNAAEEHHFYVNDENWKKPGAFILKGTSVHLGNVSDGFYNKDYAMASGVHDIEYGRIAMMFGTEFTGNYHVYLKIDDEVVLEDVQALDNKTVSAAHLFITGNDGEINRMIDVDYKEESYETPKVISVSDLFNKAAIGNSQVLDDRGGSIEYAYNNDDHTENYSLVFKFKYEVNAQEEHQFNVNNENYKIPSSFILKGTSVHLGKIEDGWHNADYTMSEGVHDIEFGRVAILKGTKFTGNYHVYLKIDDQIILEDILGLDNTTVSAAHMLITGSGVNKMIDKDYEEESYETPKVISVSDLYNNSAIGDYQVLNKRDDVQQYAYANEDHAENYSLVFKFKYEVNAAEEHHFYVNDENWKKLGAFILKGSSVHLGNVSDGFHNKDYTMASGVHDIEYGRLAIISGSEFTGNYYVYLKIDDEVVLEEVQALDNKTVSAAHLFITGNDGEINRMIDKDYEEENYENADVVNVSDLMVGGKSVGDIVTLDKHNTFTYNATAEHKSVIYKFVFEITDPSHFDSQFHFNTGWAGDLNAGMIWITDKIYMSLNSTSGKAEYVHFANPMNQEVGKYEVELGKLYITSGTNIGKYYIYCKIDGVLIGGHVAANLPNVAGLFTTGTSGNHLYDINYVEPAYEEADRITVTDLKYKGVEVGGEITLDAEKVFTYDATAAHKSVIFNFLYEVTSLTDLSCQFHFNNGYLGKIGGLIWIRNDKNFMQKSVAEESGYLSSKAISTLGLHEVEIGKIYITAGVNEGKYLLYLKIDGQNSIEYIYDSLPEGNYVFTTGKNGNHLFATNFVKAELDTSLYVYNWDSSKSGVEFTATLRKDLVDFNKVSEVGFNINGTKVAGKLVEKDDGYVVKAAIMNIGGEKLLDVQSASLYYVIPEVGTKTTKEVATTLFAELEDLTNVEEKNLPGLKALLSHLLDVTIDEDLNVTGATKTGDAEELVLTGKETSYDLFVLNGHEIKGNETIMLGFTSYKVTLTENTIKLTKVEKKVQFGGSEHFVELNKGQDEKMTVPNLSAMTSELGLNTIRFDIYLDSLFEVKEGNVLEVNYEYVNAINYVINELKANGGINDFLAVLWTIQPKEFKSTWEGEPYLTHTCPEDEKVYLKWLQINGEAAKLCAELFPDIQNYETWNEPEIKNGVDSTLCKNDGTDYTNEEKAVILTDLMYYFNKGLKEGNKDAILSTPSICSAVKTDSLFETKSSDFLALLYQAITDDTPVTGFVEVDKEPDHYFQAINLHPYTVGSNCPTADKWNEYMQEMISISEQYGDGNTPIWITEYGFPFNRAGSANELLATCEKAAAIENVTKFYFYKVHDYTEKFGNDKWGLYTYDCAIKEIGTAVKDFLADYYK